MVEETSFDAGIRGLMEDWLVPAITDSLIRESSSQPESGEI
jgi:hypothetical protein